jgi:hypothetical protein
MHLLFSVNPADHAQGRPTPGGLSDDPPPGVNTIALIKGSSLVFGLGLKILCNPRLALTRLIFK